ncbi:MULTISPECIES: hypothetical protein [unclassified Paenibacillus]|uniref:hypothetical protein n=2 Tax=Paenibacillus TaxID=44249 RepID=UPI00038F4687|nr:MULTISPECIES: hypothetical protein [unclassified Paenibacillus]CDN41734.1 hypothetical protein BN871_AK_00060 [Paenibacillus sp. P22]
MEPVNPVATTLPAAHHKTSTAPVAKPSTAPAAKPSTMPVMPEPSIPAPMPAAPPVMNTTINVLVMEKPEMKHFCDNHKYRYVLAHTKDGWCCDGFIEHYDDEYVCLAIPCDMGEVHPRAFGPGFGPGFGPYPPLYPYPYYPRRRFARAVFPLAALAGITLLPFL